MKTSKIFFLTLIVSLFFASCSNSVLDVQNPNAITQYSYYVNLDQANQAVIACYDALKGNGLYGLRMPFVSNAISDFGVFESPRFRQLIYTPSDGDIKFIWGYSYRGVTKCNLAIDKISQIKDPAMTDEIRANLIAQARFLRSLYNFILHTKFNQPPLITKVISDMQEEFGNSSWDEFLAQIEKDLIGYDDDAGNHISGAIEVLPETWDNANVGRATKGAALFLMAKTYLYHEDWEKAKEYAQKVVDLGIYSLMQAQGPDSTDYINAFLSNSSSVDLTYKGRTYKSENNDESIFSIQYAAGDFVRNANLPGWMCDGSVYNAYNGINGWRNTSCSVSYANEFEKTPYHTSGIKYDPRKYGTIYVPGDTITNDKSSPNYVPFDPKLHLLTNIKTGYGIKKYLYPLHEGTAAPYNSPNDWRLFRYSEDLLILAEAEYHINGSSAIALDAINQVRERVGLNPLTVVTPAAIVHERASELGFEGQRYWDLVRWGRLGGEWPNPSDYIEYFHIGRDEFFPIPTGEISKMHGKLVQNPGW